MSDVLQWTLELVDKITAPARKAQESLGAVSKSLDSAKQSKGFGDIATGLNQILEVAGKVTGAIKAVGGAALDVGAFVVNTGAYKQATTTALQSILHISKEEAKSVFGEIQQIANTTPFESADVADTIKKLIGSGFAKDKAFEVFKSIGDVSAFNNFDTSILTSMTDALGKVQSMGKLTGESLESLLVSSKGAFSRDSLSKALGLKDASELMKKVSAGTITATAAIGAVQKVITEGVSGGTAGGLMATLGREIPGLLSTLKDAPVSLVPSVDDSAGLQSFRGFLRLVTDALDGPGFKRIQESFGRIIDAVFGGFAGVDQSKITAFVDTLATGFESVAATLAKIDFVELFGKGADTLTALSTAITSFSGGAMEGLSTTLGPILEGMSAAGANASTWHSLGKAIGFVVGGLVWLGVRLGESLTWFWDVAAGADALLGSLFGVGSFVGELGAELGALGDILSGWYDEAASIAGDIISGLVDGITSGAAAVVDAISATVGGALDTAKEVLGIASPSKEFAQLGRFTAEGFALGIDASAMDAQNSVASMVAVPAAVPGASVGGAGAGSISVTVNINGASGDASAIRSAAENGAHEGIRRALEEARRVAA